MKSKIEKSYGSKKIVAVVCAIALVMSVGVPYAWAAAKNVTKVTLTFDEDLILCDSTGEIVLDEVDEFSQGTKTISKEEIDPTEEGKRTIVLTQKGQANFYGINSFTLSVYEDYDPVVQLTSGTNKSTPVINHDATTDARTIRFNLIPATSDLSYSITRGNPPEAPKYDYYFTPGEQYSFNDITVGGTTTALQDDMLNVTEGTEVKFKVVPQTGYSVDRVNISTTVRPLTADADGYYSFTATQEASITVSTSKAQYNITYNYPSDPAFTVQQGANTAESGTTYTFNVYTNDGYGEPTVKAYVGDKEVTVQHNGSNYWFTVSGDTRIDISSGKSKTYQVTFPTGTGYTIDNHGFTEIKHGETLRFTLNLDDDYNQSSPLVTASNGTVQNSGAGEYTLTGVTADTVISVSGIVRNPFVISGLDNENGYTVSGTGIVEGKATTRASEYTFYITTTDGYDEPSVSVNGDAHIVKTGTNQYTITNITDDVNVTITSGNIKTYNINYTEGTGYSFAENDLTAQHGTSASFKVNLTDAYSNSNIVVKANNVTLTAEDGVYTIESVTADTTVTVSGVTLNTYTITGLESIEGYEVVGDINEEGVASVTHGSSYTFYVTPKDGYKDPVVTASDKTVIKNGNQYTILNVTGSIAVTISGSGQKTYSATLNNGTGFTIKATSTEIQHNGNFEFEILLGDEYSQSTPVVKVNGAIVKPDDKGVYTVTNVTSNIVVDVTEVTKNTYKMTLSSDAGATITANGGLTVAHGDSFSYTVALTPGYELVDILVNGDRVGGQVGVNTLDNVDKDSIIEVKTKKIQNTIELNSNKSVVSGIESGQKVDYGDKISFTVTPNDYYKVNKVIVNGTEYTSVDGKTYTVTNVTTDLDITVMTSAVTLTVSINGGGYAKDEVRTYTYDGSSEITVPELKSNNSLYKFNAWTEGGTISFDSKTDKTAELTATWCVDEDYLNQHLKLTTQHKTTSSYYATTIRTYIEADSELLTNEVFRGAQIISYGTIITKNDLTEVDADFFKNNVMSGKVLIGATANGLVTEGIKDANGNQFINYYHSGSAIDPTQLGRENFIRLAMTGMNENSLKQYKAIGWIQIKIGNEVIFLTSGQWDTGLESSNDTKYQNSTLNP